ncbi:MAG: VanZ family protein [Thermoanaerobacterales bacterium]|nr:VanZ family protein [Thermoanaerobacterales bacterium]
MIIAKSNSNGINKLLKFNHNTRHFFASFDFTLNTSTLVSLNPVVIFPIIDIFYYHNVSKISKNTITGLTMEIPFNGAIILITATVDYLYAIILTSFILSLMFEVIQLITGIGNFDVDDILLNVIGSICGYIFYRVLIRLFKCRY